MPDNRRQHVVPSFYLAHFADTNGFVHVWDRRTDRSFSVHHSNVGIESECYTVMNGSVRDMSADGINGNVETHCAPHFDRLNASVMPDPDQLRAIGVLTANLITRSRHIRDRATHGMNRLIELFDKQTKLGDTGWEFLAALDPRMANAKAELERARDVTHAAVVGLGLEPTLLELRSKSLQILTAPPDSQFVTSDDPPLFLSNGTPADLTVAPGFLSSESLTIYVPLTHFMACQWCGGTVGPTKKLCVDEMRHFNSLLGDRAYRQVYSADAAELGKLREGRPV